MLILARGSRGQKGETPLWALPLEVKIEEVTLSLARKRPGYPEPDVVVPIRGIEPEADRGTEEPRIVVPGTAPQDAL